MTVQIILLQHNFKEAIITGNTTFVASIFSRDNNFTMRFFITAIFLTATFSTFAAAGDTTVIHSHANTNLVSQTERSGNYDVWATFPNDGRTWRKILMTFTLGCGTPQCSGWDYTVNTYLGKKTGTIDTSITSVDSVFSYSDTTWNYFQDSTIANIDSSTALWDTTYSYSPDSVIAGIDSFYTIVDTNYAYAPHVKYNEVGRLITPYGTYMASHSNGYSNSWKKPYYYDVTDYAALMQDSLSVRINYSGWSDAFSGTVDFYLIEGEPSRSVLQFDELYNAYINYPNKAGFEAVATPKTVSIPASMTTAKLNLIITGHGSDGEFDPHNFQIKVDGSTILDQFLWKTDCGWNVVAPQGGTWTLNRSGWCPGEKVKVYEIDLSQYLHAGRNDTIDLDYDDYTLPLCCDGNGDPYSSGYDIAAYLVSYGSQPNNDAALEEIIAPNNDLNFIRYNPIATNPKVRIKNYGKNALSQCDITYWVKGGNKCYYQWHGYLTTFQTADVTLPPFDWTGLDSTDRVFYAEVSYPNNTTDDFEPNNLLSSNFNLPPVMDSSFIIYLKTNNHADENFYVLRSEQNDTLVYRNGMANTTLYRDTTHLVNGSYAFDLFDYDVDNFWDESGLEGDGISYWLNTQSGYETAGQFFLKKLNNTNIVLYNNRYGSGNNGDFGSNLHYEFTVGAPLGYGDPKAPCTPIEHTTGIKEIEQMNLAVYPNPANENFFVKTDQSIGNSVATIFNLQGQKVYEQSIYLVNGQAAEIALPAGISTGMYVVEIRNGQNSFNRKLNVIRK